MHFISFVWMTTTLVNEWQEEAAAANKQHQKWGKNEIKREYQLLSHVHAPMMVVNACIQIYTNRIPERDSKSKFLMNFFSFFLLLATAVAWIEKRIFKSERWSWKIKWIYKCKQISFNYFHFILGIFLFYFIIIISYRFSFHSLFNISAENLNSKENWRKSKKKKHSNTKVEVEATKWSIIIKMKQTFFRWILLNIKE